MKINYNKLTLREIKVAIKRISRNLGMIQISRVPDEAKVEPIKKQTAELRLIQEALAKKTGTAVRHTLPKRVQRQKGLLPLLNETVVFES